MGFQNGHDWRDLFFPCLEPRIEKNYESNEIPHLYDNIIIVSVESDKMSFKQKASFVVYKLQCWK